MATINALVAALPLSAEELLRVAEVRQQQEALRTVLRDHLRRIQPRRAQPGGDVDERADILLVRRRVHHDMAGAPAVHPPVAAEAGVGGRASHAGRVQRLGWRLSRQPGLESPGAGGVGPDRGAGGRRGGRARGKCLIAHG